VHLLAAIKTTIQVIYDHSMTQAVSRRPLTAEARVLSQVSPCEIGEEQSVTGAGFSPSTSVFSRQYNLTSTPNSSSSTSCSYQDKWAKTEKLPKSNALSEIGSNDRKKYLRDLLKG
jgi:hypothetical protein